MSTALSDPTPHEHRHHRSRAAASDAELLAQVRAGDDDAYAVLFERHRDAAERLARQLCRRGAGADDLVADAFTAILAALRNGAGPTEAFRPYLLTTIRHRSWRGARTPEDPVDPTADGGTLDGAVLDDDGDDQRLMAEAYGSLPERWQLVLWHTEVEGQRPAEVAPLVGLSPHATAALAHRAREGLREAYLQAHLQHDTPPSCSFTVAHLGALVRDNLARRDRAKVGDHLTSCARCRHLRDELLGVNRALRTVIGPLVLGGAAAGYLGRHGSAAPATAVARATRSAGGSNARRALGATTALVLVLGFLVLRSDRSQPTPSAAAPESPAAAVAAAARPPAGDDPSASGPDVDLPGGVTVHRVATTDCADRLGVALLSQSTGAAEAGTGEVLTAVLVRDGSPALQALGVTVDGAVAAVTGPALDTLRSLTATSPASPDAPTGPGGVPSGACVTAPAATLLAPSGAWGLLVTYLPTATSGLDDLRAAVLEQPFAFLGAVTRSTVDRARTTAADALAALPDAGTALGTAGDQVAGLLDPTLAGVGSGGAGGTGGATNTGSGAGGDPVDGLTGATGGTDPITPSTLLPPLVIPTLPGGPTVTVPPLGLPLPGLP